MAFGKRGASSGRGPAPASESAGGFLPAGVSFREALRVLNKRRWPALAAMTLVLGLAMLYNVTRVPMYEARVRLHIDGGRANVGEFQEVMQQDRSNTDYYQTQYRLLQSRTLVRSTLETMKAWEAKELTAPPDRTPVGRVADAILNPTTTISGWLTRLRTPPPPGTTDGTPAQAGVVDTFLSRLTVAPVGNSRLVDASFVARDPRFAADAANALAEAYVKQSRDTRLGASDQAIEWLRSQLDEQQRAAQTSALAAQQYRERNDPLAPDDRENILVQKLAELSTAVTTASRTRIAKETQYRQVAELKARPEAIEGLPFVLANPLVQESQRALADAERQLAQLAGTFGEKHPDMVKAQTAVDAQRARMRVEIDKIVAAVYTEYQSALTEERSLTAALETQRQEALASNRRAIDYAVLERDAESNQQIVDALMQRMKEADIASGLANVDVRIVDRAEVPLYPLAQSRGSVIMAAIMAMMLAVGLAFGLEYLDSSIKTPDDIKTHLRLPYLGALPVFPKGADLEPDRSRNTREASFLEAMQTLRTNVLFSVPEDAPQTLLITSTQPGEGKTVVAQHLAAALGQVGKRVVIIDADMRRPTLHQRFDVPRSPGLSEVLAGAAHLRTSLRLSRFDLVTLLPAGQLPPNPTALLQSRNFTHLVNVLAQDYDWVIIDSPPVLPVTDAAIAASKVGAVLFVVGAEMTTKQAATQALNQLEGARAGFAGAVLNRVVHTRGAYYYSGSYASYLQPTDPRSDGVVVRLRGNGTTGV